MMPLFPIADAHVHFWDRARLPYKWLESNARINAPHLPADLHRAAEPFTLGSIVFVQAEVDRTHAWQEVEFAKELAAADPRIEAFVAFAPLHKGNAVRADLERLAAEPLVKGVRQIINFEPGLEFCLQDGFLQGLRLLGELGLAFDINITWRHLPNVIQMVDAAPRTRFVVDHIGGPDIKGGQLDPWAEGLRELAKREHVQCKLSGVATAADWNAWKEDELRPCVDHVVECFGPGRVMFGSDWPVCTLAIGHSAWAGMLARFTAELSEDEQGALWWGNARAFYGVE